jgi:hypothetical protein
VTGVRGSVLTAGVCVICAACGGLRGRLSLAGATVALFLYGKRSFETGRGAAVLLVGARAHMFLRPPTSVYAVRVWSRQRQRPWSVALYALRSICPRPRFTALRWPCVYFYMQSVSVLRLLGRAGVVEHGHTHSLSHSHSYNGAWYLILKRQSGSQPPSSRSCFTLLLLSRVASRSSRLSEYGLYVTGIVSPIYSRSNETSTRGILLANLEMLDFGSCGAETSD